MTDPAPNAAPATPRPPGILRRDAVRLASQAAMVECGAASAGRPAHTLAVVPLLDGDRLAGFEVRCGCGASAVVECVYAEES
jgi:hypothetical protein